MPQTLLDPSNTQNDRDANGRFCAGNKGGPGNPHARHAGELRRSLLEADEKDLRQAIRAVIEKAKAGDVAAAKLVLQYTLGTPKAMPDPDRLDVEEWKLVQASGVAPEEVVAECQAAPVQEVLCPVERPMANASNGGAAPGNGPMANGAIGRPVVIGVKEAADIAIANGSNGGPATLPGRVEGRGVPKANGSIGDKRRKKKKPPGRRRKRR